MSRRVVLSLGCLAAWMGLSISSSTLRAEDILTPQLAINRLAADQPAELRKQTLEQLREKKAPEYKELIPLLTGMLEDADLELRYEVIVTLGLQLKYHEQPCSLKLVQACFNSTEKQEEAIAVLGIFESFPKEAVPVFLEHVESENFMIRHSVMNFLGATSVSDEDVLLALRKGTEDPDILVRGNALVALARVSDDYELVVPRWIPIIESFYDDGSDAAKSQLAATGTMMALRRLGQQHPEEIGQVLMSLMDHESPEIRGPAARLLGAVAQDNPESFRALKDLKADEAIRPLLRDPDATVRRNAALGLKHFRNGPRTEDAARKEE